VEKGKWTDEKSRKEKSLKNKIGKIKPADARTQLRGETYYDT
jgi:hypothetical protein